MPPGDHGIPMTSSQQVLFAVVLKCGCEALGLFDCQLQPARLVLDPQLQKAATLLPGGKVSQEREAKIRVFFFLSCGGVEDPPRIV